jgi:hypothetical protein
MTEDLDSNEISLLDLLVTMAKSWRLLVFGPIVAGLIGMGVAFGLPATYHSEAKLLLPDGQPFTRDVAMALPESDEFLLAVSQQAGLGGFAGDQQAVDSIRERLRTQAQRNSPLLVLRAAGPTPEKARALAQVAVEELLRRSVPSGVYRRQIEGEIANARKAIEGYQLAQGAISRWVAKPLPGNTNDAFISALVSLQANNEESENRIMRLQAQLRGVGEAAVINKPNLPLKKTSPKRSLIAVLSGLVAGFALLLWVFVQQAWRDAANRPETADKVKALRAAFSAPSANRSS